MNQKLLKRIQTLLLEAGARGLRFRELLVSCGIKTKSQHEFRECLRYLEAKGVIIDRKIKIYHTSCLKLKEATVIRINKTFGFVKLTEDDSEVFIPGKYFMGAMPGDTVLVAPIKSRGESPEGEIVKILSFGKAEFVGTLRKTKAGYYVVPDSIIKYELNVLPKSAVVLNARDGDKVLCQIAKRGERHSEHIAKVIACYGDAQTAVNCAEAILDLNGISREFPDDVSAEANAINSLGISKKELEAREDLQDELIFTIDSADTKDIDDAISIKKYSDFYILGVHIADVSYYVKQGSVLDKEAFRRGTSIYFADRVVPMLPPALSNGICSLNENEPRLAFSCIMTVDLSGKLVDFEFKKTVIRSKVKGVYSEINQILAHTETNEIKKKYEKLYDSIFTMKELADILTDNKKKRGAPEIETSESKIILDENSVAVDVVPRERGASEVIIEEFMLMANEAAATAARLKEIPFVYRVHEPPSEDKIETLNTLLSALSISTVNVKTGLPSSVLAKILEDSKGKPAQKLINTLVLRSMSKAKYFEQPLGHYGLVLQNYAQFTSPIRRYPDLTIHRILSDVVRDMPLVKLRKKYEKLVVEASRQSTETELSAMRLERDCDDCYKAEYMKAHVGEEFDGIISSVAPQGIYVELQNSVEGLLKTEDMPEGNYQFDELLEMRETLSGKSYRIGDKIKVKCIKADVAQGNVDFSLAE